MKGAEVINPKISEVFLWLGIEVGVVIRAAHSFHCGL